MDSFLCAMGIKLFFVLCKIQDRPVLYLAIILFFIVSPSLIPRNNLTQQSFLFIHKHLFRLCKCNCPLIIPQIKNRYVDKYVYKVYIQQKLNYVKLKIKPLNKEWLFYTYFSNCG